MNEELIKHHQELATKNAQAAVKMAGLTRDELLERVDHLDAVVLDLTNRVIELDRKYALLLTERFDGKGTAA